MDVATILILNYNCLNLAWVWETNFNTVGLLQLYLLRETEIDMHNLTYSLNEVFFFDRFHNIVGIIGKISLNLLMLAGLLWNKQSLRQLPHKKF